jgi:aspartate aminotransferase
MLMISPDLDALLRPLERFEAIRRSVVTLGDRLCDLSYGNPYDGATERTRAILRDALDSRRMLDLQYSPFAGNTIARRAVAEHLTESHGLPFNFGDVILTPGATAALHLALRAAGGGAPGDEVIVPVPCWLDYPLYAHYLGLTPILVPFAPGEFRLNVPAIADAITARTCGVLLNHPANPTGRNHQAAELEALAATLHSAEQRTGRSITLIADEVHRDYVPAGAYRSATAVWPRTLIVYSFGKYHFLQGQRLGYAAVSPRHPERRGLGAELVRWTRIMGFVAPSALMQRAVPGLLALRHDTSWLQRWRARFTTELAAAGYDVVAADGTMFLYVKTPEPFDDFEFIKELARAGVLALPAPLFHHRGYFRLSLTGTEHMLERALATLCRLPARCATYV